MLGINNRYKRNLFLSRKSMYGICAILGLSFFLSGCASLATSDQIRSLEKRVSRIERKQVVDDAPIPVVQKTYNTSYQPEVVKKSYSSLPLSSKDIQRALADAGYYFGPIDGKIGPKSVKAIKDFQTDNGLKIDGKAGPQTQTALSRYLSAK